MILFSRFRNLNSIHIFSKFNMKNLQIYLIICDIHYKVPWRSGRPLRRFRAQCDRWNCRIYLRWRWPGSGVYGSQRSSCRSDTTAIAHAVHASISRSGTVARFQGGRCGRAYIGLFRLWWFSSGLPQRMPVVLDQSRWKPDEKSTQIFKSSKSGERNRSDDRRSHTFFLGSGKSSQLKEYTEIVKLII